MLFDKKFDLVVSIGEDCACTSYLRRFNLQDCSFPFDWSTKASFETRINLLVNNFDNFLNKENIVLMQKPHNDNVDESHDYYKDTVLDFYFYHDFKADVPFDEEFFNVKNKYNRRIKYLYQGIEESADILFVWWGRTKQLDEGIIINSWEKINEKFKDKNIYFLLIEPSEKYIEKLFCNNHVLLIQYDNYSWEHNPHWNQTMGNETNNMKIFSQIKKKRFFKWYIKIAIYKFVKIFIDLIPNRNIRRFLKSRWSYMFFKNKL